MHNKIILRSATAKDIPGIKHILKVWLEEDPSILNWINPQQADTSTVRSRVMEFDKKIRAIIFWMRDLCDEVRILAFGFDRKLTDPPEQQRFIKEIILEWSELGISKATVRIPEALSASLMAPLKTSGFMFEGISSCCGPKQIPRVHLCKHFLYKTIQYSKVIDFLREFLSSLGYEIRAEEDGFGFRLKQEYRLPFIFSPWHRITRSGPDIIIHPPARVLEMHELETLFYPLQIRVSGEKPLLLPLERKRAETLIDLPNGQTAQSTLFDPETYRSRTIYPNNLAFSLPAVLNSMRKGLPLLFYINRIGAVGAGRVEDYYLDEPKNLFNHIDDMSFFDPADVMDHAMSSGTKAGKILVIRFHWYRPFKKVVSFEEIKKADDSFNPQRTRVLSAGLFNAITNQGNDLAHS